MVIYVYCDESGVFDRVHYDYFVFGGVIVLDKKPKDSYIRMFKKAEKNIAEDYEEGTELKASIITPQDKGKLFRATNKFDKFGVVVNQKKILPEVFKDKINKQRYLDYAFLTGLKNAFETMMHKGQFSRDEIDSICVQFDEHNTATKGGYELRQTLRNEFVLGSFNYHYTTFFKPLFPSIDEKTGFHFDFCNSKTNALIRASDIIANRIFTEVKNGGSPYLRSNLYVTELPYI